MLASHAQKARFSPQHHIELGRVICFIMLALRMWKQGDQMLNLSWYIMILRSV